MKMFSITEEGYMLASDPYHPIEFMNTVNQVMFQVFMNCIKDAPEEHKQAAKEELYDAYNQAASAFLEALAPDLELRPDLTAEAILEMENQLLEQKAEEIEED